MRNEVVVVVKNGRVVGIYSNDLESDVEVIDVTNANKEEKDFLSKRIENLYDVS
jgi:hypothetical protein